MNTGTLTRDDYEINSYLEPDYDAEEYEDGEWMWNTTRSDFIFFVDWTNGMLFKRDRRYGDGVREIGETTSLNPRHCPRVHDRLWTCDARTREEFESRWHTQVGWWEGSWGYQSMTVQILDDDGKVVEDASLSGSQSCRENKYFREIEKELTEECFGRMGL